MTSKELLYIEDALGHETFFQQKCQNTAQDLTDLSLSNYVQQLKAKHTEIFNQIYNLL